MKIDVYKKKKLLRGLSLFTPGVFEKTFRNDKELEESMIFSPKKTKWLIPDEETNAGTFYRSIKKHFKLNGEKTTGFFSVERDRIYESAKYLWQNLTADGVILKLFSNLKRGVSLKSCVEFTAFLNLLIKEIMDSEDKVHWDHEMPSMYLKNSRSGFLSSKVVENFLMREGEHYFFRSSNIINHYDSKIILAKKRKIGEAEIQDVLFKVENRKPRRFYDKMESCYLCVIDGKLKIPNEKDIAYFGENSNLKLVRYREKNASANCFIKTKYILVKKDSVSPSEFNEGVYYALDNPPIIFYDELPKVISDKITAEKIMSKIEANIYSPKNASIKWDWKEGNMITLGVLDKNVFCSEV